MSSVFIRGLWGENRRAEYATRGHPLTRREILRTLKWKTPEPEPSIHYTFGTDNHDWLTSKGVPNTKLSDEGIVNWYNSTEPRDPLRGGVVNWGVSYWRHKLRCLQVALQDHDEVVWLDWDYRLEQSVPEDFWDVMRAGQPLQSCLREYRNIQCPWRVQTSQRRRVSQGTFEENLTCHGSFIYCRELSIAEQLLAHQETYPTRSDEPALCRWAEDQLGGWTSDDVLRYLYERYEPYCCWAKWHVFKPRTIVFRNYGKR